MPGHFFARSGSHATPARQTRRILCLGFFDIFYAIKDALICLFCGVDRTTCVSSLLSLPQNSVKAAWSATLFSSASWSPVRQLNCGLEFAYRTGTARGQTVPPKPATRSIWISLCVYIFGAETRYLTLFDAGAFCANLCSPAPSVSTINTEIESQNG